MVTVLKVQRNTVVIFKVCGNVAMRSALGIVVHSLFVGAATGVGTTSVV